MEFIARFDFLQFYLKDKLAKNIDEREGSPLVKELMVRQDCIRIKNLIREVSVREVKINNSSSINWRSHNCLFEKHTMSNLRSLKCLCEKSAY